MQGGPGLRVDFTDVVVQFAIGAVLGVVFLLAGWFVDGDLRAVLFVVSALASLVAVGFAARTRSTLWAAVSGAVAMAALLSSLFTFTSARQISVSPSTAPATPFAVAFTQPADGAVLPLAGGTALGSISSAIGDEQSLWMVIANPEGGPVRQVKSRLEVTGLNWSVFTGQLGSGNPGEVGKTFLLEVVLADSAAAKEFEAAVAGSLSEGMRELPKGASVVATRSVVRAADPLIVRIDTIEPRDGLPGISSSQGFEATGLAQGIQPGESLWLMDKDDVGLNIAQEATVADSKWSALSFPLGDEGARLPFTMEAAIVKADQSCSNALRLEMNTDDLWLQGLPDGCLEMDTRSLEVTRP